MKPGIDRMPRRRGEEGIALIYVAVFLLVSLWFVSLAIDMGKIMAAKTELQAAADAAALAGASAIDPETAVVDQDSARVRAAYTALQNKALEQVKTPIVIDPMTDVEFPAPDRVKVTVHRDASHDNPVIMHFAQTLGVPSVGVRADATAEAKALTSVCEGLAPFAPQQPPDGVPFSTDCDSVYTLKVGAQGQQQGNFQLLDFPDCPEDEFTGGGADAVKQYTIHGYKCCIGIGDEFVSTQPGNMVGPFRTALQTRWDADTDQTSHCYEDYTGNGSRVFITPIIETFDLNGKKLARIVNFAAFFLKERPTGSMSQTGVPGQFIKYVAPGDFGSTPPESTGVYGIHLVE